MIIFEPACMGDIRHRNSVEKSSFELTIKNNIQLQPLPVNLILGFEPKSRGFEPESRGFEPESRGFEPKSRRFEPKSRGFEPKSRGFEPKSGGFEPKSRS